MSDQLVLEAKSVSKFFGTITALENVNLQLNKGEVLGVVKYGPNGYCLFKSKTQETNICCNFFSRAWCNKYGYSLCSSFK